MPLNEFLKCVLFTCPYDCIAFHHVTEFSLSTNIPNSQNHKSLGSHYEKLEQGAWHKINFRKTIEQDHTVQFADILSLIIAFINFCLITFFVRFK